MDVESAKVHGRQFLDGRVFVVLSASTICHR